MEKRDSMSNTESDLQSRSLSGKAWPSRPSLSVVENSNLAGFFYIGGEGGNLPPFPLSPPPLSNQQLSIINAVEWNCLVLMYSILSAMWCSPKAGLAQVWLRSEQSSIPSPLHYALSDFPDNAHLNNVHADDVFSANQIRELKNLLALFKIFGTKITLCKCAFNTSCSTCDCLYARQCTTTYFYLTWSFHGGSMNKQPETSRNITVNLCYFVTNIHDA